MILNRDIKCRLCGQSFKSWGVLREHLSELHFLNWFQAAEIFRQHTDDLLSSDRICYKCSEIRPPLTYILPEVSQPCWSCLSTRKSDRNEAFRTMISEVKNYYERVRTDRLLQLFLVDEIYKQTSIDHSYEPFRKAVTALNLPSRNEVWVIDWKPGYPKTISLENTTGLQPVSLSPYYKVESSEKEIVVNNWRVQLSEIVPYDVRHHARHSLLNPNSARKTKRLRLGGTDTCIKLFPTKGGDVHKIFNVVDKNTGEQVDFTNFKKSDFTVIKLTLLRNKTFMRRLIEVVMETLNHMGTFIDPVFLHNTVTINPDRLERILELSWIPKEVTKEGHLNLSIL